MEDLIGYIRSRPNSLKVLISAIQSAAPSIAEITSWFIIHFASPPPDVVLTGGGLDEKLLNLLIWAQSNDGGLFLLQTLVDDPPNRNQALPETIVLLTGERIRPTRANSAGPPGLPPHLSFFAADRPFVNRDKLRDHLRRLGTTVSGPKSILVVQGDPQTGKTYSVRLASHCLPPEKCVPIDVLFFQQGATTCDVMKLVQEIDRYRSSQYPAYDQTKEHEYLPTLLGWLRNRLREGNEPVWIIIDHCRSPVMTDAARLFLAQLAQIIDQGMLPNVHLVLIDFDTTILHPALRDNVLADIAVLPDDRSILKWVEAMVDAEKRQCPSDDLKIWVGELWNSLSTFRRETGEWQLQLDRQLRLLAERIRTLAVSP